MAERVIDTLVTVFGFRTDRGQLDRARRDIRAVRDGLDGMARSVGVAGAAAAAALFSVGRTVVEFERSQNRIAAVYLDRTREQLAPLREQARQLGAVTSRTATEAANAQVELARAGFELNETLAATPRVLDLAIAGELEMREAALLVTSQLNAFGVSADEAGRVTDVLAAIASSSATSVRQLGPALRQVSALAAAAGLSLEEVGAALGLLRDSGLQAEAAGTALRGVLARLSDPNPPAAMIEGLASLGLTAEEVQSALSVGGLAGVMRLLGGAGLSAADAIQIFGVEAASAAVSLSARSSDLIVFEERLRDVDGTAERMRERMAEGLPGATATFGSALQELQLALGESGITGGLIKLLDYGTRFLRLLSRLPAPLQALIGWMAAVAAAVGAVGVAIQAAGFAFGFAVAPAKALVVAMWGLTAALLANPITWIILAIVALIAILVLLVIHFDTVRDVAIRVWGGVLSAMREVWEWITNNWPLLAATLGGPFTMLPYLVWRFRDTIISALRGLWDWVSGLVGRLTGWLDGIIDRVGRVVGAVRFWDRGGDDAAGGGGSIVGSLGSAPAAPSFAAAVPSGVSGARIVEAQVNLDRIDISVERGDPDEIAAQVGVSLQRQLQDTAEDFGGRIVG